MPTPSSQATSLRAAIALLSPARAPGCTASTIVAAGECKREGWLLKARRPRADTARREWRRRWFLIGLVSGAVIGAGRIMQGGHFLSDVIFAFYTVWLSCELVAWIDHRRLQRSQPPPSRPNRPTF